MFNQTQSRSRTQTVAASAMGWREEWPLMTDGAPYDGKDLIQLAAAGKSPFDRGTSDC